LATIRAVFFVSLLLVYR